LINIIHSYCILDDNGKLLNVENPQVILLMTLVSILSITTGNGPWCGATKYNFLCNSVTAIVSPKNLGGEQWETRASLGMIPGIHYLELSPKRNEICEDLKMKILWIKKHPEEAYMMAQRSREIALNYLNRNHVLKDFATLLLGYSSLNKSITLQPEVKKILLENFSYDNGNTL
jgi:hypothetical protein